MVPAFVTVAAAPAIATAIPDETINPLARLVTWPPFTLPTIPA